MTPQLSRSCKFLYRSNVANPLPKARLIINKVSARREGTFDGTKSEDLPQGETIAEHPRCKDRKAPQSIHRPMSHRNVDVGIDYQHRWSVRIALQYADRTCIII